jgi:superfamily II DNA or RNA helicase
MGRLCPPRIYKVPVDLTGIKKRGNDYDAADMGREYTKRKVYAGVIENYKLRCPGTKALVFAASIESAEELAYRMRAAGITAKAVHSKMPDAEADERVAWYRATPGAVLVNVDKLTTGFDAPETETVIIYRATMSLPLWLQMCGRGGRTYPGKKWFNLLDFGGNGDVHGWWHQPRTWTLEKVDSRKKQPGPPPMKTCPNDDCGALIHVSARTCPHCGTTCSVPKEEQDRQEIVMLEELGKRERLAAAEQGSLAQKVLMAKNKLISPFWVLHRCKTWEEAKEFTDAMEYKNGFWHYNWVRFPHLNVPIQYKRKK